MSRRADTPRDLLFGLLALQNGLIDQDHLVAAFRAWSSDKARPMAEILLAQKAIEVSDCELLKTLAARLLERHGGDAEKSLASLGAGHSTREKLAALADSDLNASLAGVGTAIPLDADPDATASFSFGASTTDGQRFRVLRFHAKGGLGAVFVALDAELNREVALKQILEHHADNPVSQNRFLVEAEITGGLEHPGIVPVYGLGHDDFGRPYYAMRFIKGDNLKQAIERFHADETLKADPGARSLALRKLLRRFTDVCNAIEYAHSRGVLHRDIKPGNVIVGKHGETLVVDWGLAKARGRAEPESAEGERVLIPSSASGSAETLPGHAIGTPAYMSPEQAVGDLDRLGPRSDVYSLGATLYSLLTGCRPFEGQVGEVLANVQEGRFPRPRSLDPTIDPALEALCLKAMARLPQDRYPGPKVLAEDLDRWSADEPVSAWKEPLARRARRWTRRHRTGVTAASASVLALLVGLAGILAVQSKANRDLNSKNNLLLAAIGRETKANADLKLASDEVRARNVKLAEANARESKINADLKLANERVQARFDLARESIDAFRTTVTDDQILQDEQFRPLRDKLLRSAAEFYGKLGALLEGQPDRRSRQALADAYGSLGNLSFEIGDQTEALAVYNKAVSIRRDLARSRDPRDRLALAKDLVWVGTLSEGTGHPADALTTYEEVRRLLESETWPPELASEADSKLATSHNNIGLLLANTGEPGKALESLGRALAIQERLASSNPAVTEFQSRLAASHTNIGSLLARTGEPGKALESYDRALAIQERLASANPAVTEFQSRLAISHNNIGSLLARTGEPGKALESHGRALAIRERLASANPAVNRFQAELATSHNNIGLLLANTGEPGKALESYRRALAIRDRLTSANPAVNRFQAELATSHNNIGGLLANTGEPGKALESHGRALAIRERLASANPAVTGFQAELATSHNNIGGLLANTGEPGKALESHRRALAIRERLASANPAVTGFQADLAASHNNIGLLLANTGEPGKALESYRRALAIQERLASSNPAVTEFQSHLAVSHSNIGLLLARTGEPGEALESHRRALAIRERLARANPTLVEYQTGLMNSLIGFGLTADRLNRSREAVENLRRGITLGERLARQPSDFYNTASYQARLSGAASKLGSGVSAEEARAEADRAMAMLRRAVAKGYRNVRHMQGNKNLDPIRSRRDFQELLMDLAFPVRPFSR